MPSEGKTLQKASPAWGRPKGVHCPKWHAATREGPATPISSGKQQDSDTQKEDGVPWEGPVWTPLQCSDRNVPSGRVAAWGGRAIDCSLALELERQLGKHAGRRTPLKPPMMPRAQA
ncbi:unnamed protein product [Gadus morhua 'NCC']